MAVGDTVKLVGFRASGAFGAFNGKLAKILVMKKDGTYEVEYDVGGQKESSALNPKHLETVTDEEIRAAPKASVRQTKRESTLTPPPKESSKKSSKSSKSGSGSSGSSGYSSSVSSSSVLSGSDAYDETTES